MTTYYVRASMGSDANDGEAPTTAWLTLGKAESVVVAGDTVYIGTGYYREQWDALTSGSVGSPITFIGDVTGYYTGDAPGFVIVTSWDITGLSTRPSAMTFLATITFRIWKNIVYNGNSYETPVSYVVQSTNTGDHVSFEGVEFHRCSILAMANGVNNRYGFGIFYGNGVEPATTGLVLKYCTVMGLQISYVSQATAPVNVKARIDRCVLGSYHDNGTLISRIGAAATPNYTIGGIAFRNSIFINSGGYQFSCTNLTNVTNPVLVEDCTFNFYPSSSGFPVYGNNTVPGAVLTRRTRHAANYSSETSTVTHQGFDYNNGELIVVGFHDYAIKEMFDKAGIYERSWSLLKNESNQLAPGWSTYDLDAIEDVYGVRSAIGSPRYLPFMGTVTDPDTAWIGDNYPIDYIIAGNKAELTSTGSATSKYLQIAGTTSLAGFDLGTIYSVQFRIIIHAFSSTGVIGFEVATSGRSEILLTESALDIDAIADASKCHYEYDLPIPAGGWSNSVLENLQVRVWKPSGVSTVYFRFATLLIFCENWQPADRGPVEYLIRPVLSTAQKHTGSTSVELMGHSVLERTLAASVYTYTISVWVRKDATYAGAQPTLKLIEAASGTVLETDTMTVGADEWEQLTITHEFQTAILTTIRMSSYCLTSAGLCWFDDLEIAKE